MLFPFSLSLMRPVGAVAIALSLSLSSPAQACSETDNHVTSLPIFNAAALVPIMDPEGAIDDASFEGLGAVALFAQPQAPLTPAQLVSSFPDLATDGSEHASLASPLKAPAAGGDQAVILINDQQFDVLDFLDQIKTQPTPWIALTDHDVKALLNACDDATLQQLERHAHRLLYGSITDTLLTSFQAERFHRLMSQLSQSAAENIMFRNAERLYHTTIIAP